MTETELDVIASENLIHEVSETVNGASLVLQGRIAHIRGENILFSAERGAVFSLNETAAEIWRALDEGMSPEAVSLRLAAHGVRRDLANRHVNAAIESWGRLGLIRPCAPSALIASSDGATQVVALPGIHIRIVYPTGRTIAARSLFRHLEARTGCIDVLLQLVEQRDLIHLFRNGKWLQVCYDDELGTVLKGQLLTEVLEKGGYEVAIHAAALVRDNRALLLCGRPGAGKTTLTLALIRTGFQFAGDDVTLLDSRGRSIGLPFAPAVKVGAWPILAEHYPELETMPVFRRPDRKRVRYPVPEKFVPFSPKTVGWVLLLRRNQAAIASLEPVDPAGALRGMLNGAFTPQGEVTGSAFDALAQVLDSAQVYCLNYSGLKDATRLIRGLCEA